MTRPGIDTTLQIMQVGEALALQKCDDLQTSHPVMTNYDRRMRLIEIVNVGGYVLHRQMPAAGDVRELPLPWLTNIQQQRTRIRFHGQCCVQLLNGHLTPGHPGQKSKRDGCAALISGGTTVSNSPAETNWFSAVLVISIAFMTGASPTMAKNRPPILSRGR